MAKNEEGKNPEEEKNPKEGQSEEELTQKIAELEEQKTNLVDEIKEDRQKRQELQTQIEDLQGALKEATQKPNDSGGEDLQVAVRQAVTEVLSEENASKAKSNKIAAIEKFVTDNKEFHEDNDPTGKKREALETKLQQFNLDGVVSVNDFLSVIGDAARLLGVDTTSQASGASEVKNPYSSTPKPSVTPAVAENGDISSAERKLIEQSGMSEEKFLKLRESMPDYIESLL